MPKSDLPLREKVRALRQVATYRPRFTVLIVFAGIVTAVLEGIGLSFLIPVIEIAQAEGDPAEDADGAMELFVMLYQFLGVPLTLETAILGMTLVIGVRYLASFVTAWLGELLRVDYTRTLQRESFEHALDAQTKYFDEEGSDDILNAIITQTVYAGETIYQIVKLFKQVFIALMYLAVALYLAPLLTVAAVLFLGLFTVFVRNVLEPGYVVGDRVAQANEDLQELVQAGTQGIRDVRVFSMKMEILREFRRAVDQFAEALVRVHRNEAAIENFYQLGSAITLFALIYVAVGILALPLSALGVIVFAIFRIADQASYINSILYQIEGNLPHFVRTHEFVEELTRNEEPDEGTRSPPTRIGELAFEDVTFSYDEEPTLDGVSFSARRGEFIAFVGRSGAGKSTIVSLLARFYTPDGGAITVDGTPIEDLDLDEWRSELAIVRQQPYLFNDTLRYNLTVGNRDVSEEELNHVCEIAQVTEFLDRLPDGYETDLGDQGVKLSGGQRQRVALARALLKDAQILILDEATSDLDTYLEQRVHNAIEEMDRDYTVIAIAHRLSTITGADRIYTLADGEIVERGTHEELLDQEARYHQLYSAQYEA